MLRFYFSMVSLTSWLCAMTCTFKCGCGCCCCCCDSAKGNTANNNNAPKCSTIECASIFVIVWVQSQKLRATRGRRVSPEWNSPGEHKNVYFYSKHFHNKYFKVCHTQFVCSKQQTVLKLRQVMGGNEGPQCSHGINQQRSKRYHKQHGHHETTRRGCLETFGLLTDAQHAKLVEVIFQEISDETERRE